MSNLTLNGLYLTVLIICSNSMECVELLDNNLLITEDCKVSPSMQKHEIATRLISKEKKFFLLNCKLKTTTNKCDKLMKNAMDMLPNSSTESKTELVFVDSRFLLEDITQGGEIPSSTQVKFQLSDEQLEMDSTRPITEDLQVTPAILTSGKEPNEKDNRIQFSKHIHTPTTTKTSKSKKKDKFKKKSFGFFFKTTAESETDLIFEDNGLTFEEDWEDFSSTTVQSKSYNEQLKMCAIESNTEDSQVSPSIHTNRKELSEKGKEKTFFDQDRNPTSKSEKRNEKHKLKESNMEMLTKYTLEPKTYLIYEENTESGDFFGTTLVKENSEVKPSTETNRRASEIGRSEPETERETEETTEDKEVSQALLRYTQQEMNSVQSITADYDVTPYILTIQKESMDIAKEKSSYSLNLNPTTSKYGKYNKKPKLKGSRLLSNRSSERELKSLFTHKGRVTSRLAPVRYRLHNEQEMSSIQKQLLQRFLETSLKKIATTKALDHVRNERATPSRLRGKKPYRPLKDPTIIMRMSDNNDFYISSTVRKRQHSSNNDKLDAHKNKTLKKIPALSKRDADSKRWQPVARHHRRKSNADSLIHSHDPLPKMFNVPIQITRSGKENPEVSKQIINLGRTDKVGIHSRSICPCLLRCYKASAQTNPTGSKITTEMSRKVCDCGSDCPRRCSYR